ncbi:MAG: hypothetical protein J6033_00555 [Lachnospiraceae bacterium]|nr:hypothetical protein [Lachnospiraceae bacterium]
MKRNTVIVTIICALVIAILVGVYAFLAGRQRDIQEEAMLTVVEQTLARDLSNDYPASPKEVVKYYNEILKCYYNEECTNEDIDALGVQARGVFDEELNSANELGTYLVKIRNEVESFKENGNRLSYTNLPPSTDVDYFEADGFSFAKLIASYTIKEGNGYVSMRLTYLLRRDEEKHWKIYGWQPFYDPEEAVAAK